MMFRRQALRQLEAPEELDDVVRLATVPGWLLTAALLLTIAATGAWGVYGTVARTVRAAGVLVHSNGVSGLDATASGQIVKVWTAANVRIAKGTPIYSAQRADGTVDTVGAPWDAYVVSLAINEGQLVQPGTRVAEMERLDAPGDALQAVVFVPASSAPLLRVGNTVAVTAAAAPSTVFGTMLGVVTSVGAFPETPESLRAFLGNGPDVQALLAGGAVVRVVVPLRTDPASPSGLHWTKASPPFQLNSTSQIEAVFTIAREHPITWLVG
ncbi:HlyD family efflux transporter periplasmic adaptor subunit [Dactylosporangium sp. CA-233914]|uniref:HlyD family efflux transporter periplasmic adaptor subunit n=1 Tax=Dactylosporangium sp. CA-233914 TaxID=3239934 RepID=UPI003D91FA2D